uniref:Reverse transcriptase domain-containing protein n=1 Tax=Tanacetum cinerariifolium TaxID=118510 RepID=A0A699I7Z1_TANCI|nr:reverse transcriptase domain-containing protein [Tanacetum cinerariifolium]
MRTRSSSNLPVESSPNPTSSNPKRRNHRRSKQPFILKESPVYTMADQRSMAELLRAPTEASVKAVEEICVTCGGVHPYYQCLATGGNTFSELRDNIQGYVAAAAVNYNQGNSGYRPSAITTRSGIVLDGPSVPILLPFINPKEDERVEETLADQDLAEDLLHPNIPYPSRMLKQKQQDKDEVQIHKFWQMFKQLHINFTLADALILIPKYQKMLKALLSNKEKLLELANTPLNEDCSAVILKKLPEKLRDPGKFLIPCGFSELKCKALADLGASINLMPLSIWKKLGLPELISTRMTLELANRAICTPVKIARDVFVLIGKFTFPANFVIFDYESDPRESINMINIYDDSSEDFLKDLFATNHQSSNPTFSSHLNLTSPEVKDDVFDLEGGNVLIEKFLDLDSTEDLHPPHNVNPLSASTTSSSPNHLLKEFADELALITFPPGNDDLPFDIDKLADLNDNLVDTMPKMFTDEHDLDYSSPPLYDEYDDDLFEVESVNEYVYHDPFDSQGEKIKESKLLIDELDLPSDFLPFSKYDSFLFKDFSKVDALPSTNNKDKDFDPPLNEPPFFKEVPSAETPLSFPSKNEEKVFKPRILTSKGVHSSLILELSHRGYKFFKIILKSPMEIFLFSYGEDIRILDVPFPHFYPP